MTNNQKARILAAIADCDLFIDKESPRNQATRPTDMQKYLDFCIAHKARLVKMLEPQA